MEHDNSGLLSSGRLRRMTRVDTVQFKTAQSFCKSSFKIMSQCISTSGEPLSCAVFAIGGNITLSIFENSHTNAPKSRFSLIRTIRTPGTSSSASGFSLIGFHLSVPGIRPLNQRKGWGLRQLPLLLDNQIDNRAHQNRHPRPR